MNIGARLQQAAGLGEVLVGEATRQLVRVGVEFDELRTIEAKGIRGPAASVAGARSPAHQREGQALVDRRRSWRC